MKVKRIMALVADIERICNGLNGQLTGGKDPEMVVMSPQDGVQVSVFLSEYRDSLLAKEVPNYGPWEP